jgi:ribosomal protein L40E
MLLTDRRARELLLKHGVFAREICDKCGAVLGAVRFTRKDESSVWCSRECRDEADAHAPGTCRHCHATLPAGKRRGSAFCDDACKQAAHRLKIVSRKSRTAKLPVTKDSFNAAFSPENLPVRVASHQGVLEAWTH